jgi:hypothetical protein
VITSYNPLALLVTSEGKKINHLFSTDKLSISATDTQSGKISTTREGSMSADLKDSVAFEIGYSVPEVQAVFAVLEKNRVLHVWAVVPEHDRTVYRKIYAKEKEIIRQFASLDFDFNILSSRGRDPKTLISDPEAQLAFVRK